MIIFKVIPCFSSIWDHRFFGFSIYFGLPLVILWYAFARKKVFKEDRAKKVAGFVSGAYIVFAILATSTSSTGGIGLFAALLDAIVLDLLVYFASIGFLRLRKRA